MKKRRDTFKIPNLAEMAPEQRYEELETLANQAHAEKIISPLPESEAEAMKSPVGSQPTMVGRLPTIRDRLFLLGYLGSSNGSAELDQEFRKAITRFQQDANLTADGWAGKQTWKALQELVGFDTPTNPEHWFHEPGPAALRAVQRRLHAMDLSEKKPDAKNPNLDRNGLKKFAQTALLLKLGDQPLQPEPVFETLSVLFDQDAIIQRLSENFGDYQTRRPSDLTESKARIRVKKFMVSVARIELWLTGQSLKPGRSVMNGAYKLAMTAFWVDQGIGLSQAREKAKTLDSSFFKELCRIQREGEMQTDEETSQHLDQYLDSCSPEETRLIWASIQKLGARLWDGLKRAWGWFKNAVVTGVKKVAHFVSNIGRLLYRYALKGVDILKTSLKAMTESIHFFFSKPLQGSNPNGMYIARDRSWDLKVWVNGNAPQEQIEQQLDDLKLKTRLFGIGATILKATASIIMTVITSPARGGWFGFILAMYRVFKKLRVMDGLTHDYKQLLQAEI